MATPDYSFIYPNTAHRFFVVYNTFYDLPQTIPMDLATFIAYHFESGRYLEGLYECYPDLIQSGCTLKDFSIQEFISAAELSYQHDLILHYQLLQTADLHQEASLAIHQILFNKTADRAQLKSIIKAHNINVRPLSFYNSMHQTIDWEFNEAQNMEPSPEETQLIQKEFEIYPLEIEYQPKQKFIEQPHEVYLNYITKEGMPLDLVPHLYRFNQLYRTLCEQQNLQFLLADCTAWGEDKIEFHLKHRIGPDQFYLVQREFDVEIARTYLQQVCTFYENVSAQLDAIGGKIEDLSLEQIEKLLCIEHEFGWTENLMPELEYDPSRGEEVRYVYYFNPPNQAKSYFPIIYTNIELLSFDQGGLAKMQVFNQYYVLCSAIGEELSPSNCQDLEIGINGFIIMRAPPGWWEYCQFRYRYGLSDVQDEFPEIRPHDLISLEFRDMLPFMYEEFMGEQELLFYEGKGSKETLLDLLKRKELANPCSDVLVAYYRADDELAKEAILQHYQVFTLLTLEQINNPLLINAFAINAPTGFYKLAAKIFDLPEFAA